MSQLAHQPLSKIASCIILTNKDLSSHRIFILDNAESFLLWYLAFYLLFVSRRVLLTAGSSICLIPGSHLEPCHIQLEMAYASYLENLKYVDI